MCFTETKRVTLLFDIKPQILTGFLRIPYLCESVVGVKFNLVAML